MDNYEKGPQIGRGTFSKVYRGRQKKTDTVVALKKVRMGDGPEGVHIAALREMEALTELQHPCVIRLLDTFKHKRKQYLVLDYMESDLEALLKNPESVELSEGVVKTYMKALLEALSACHANSILHRDVKPNNLLVAKDGTVRLSDFGLARFASSPDSAGAPMTLQISHTWYKAPEVMLGDKHYGTGVDMWAAGCVFAELMRGKALFSGQGEIEQLHLIFEQLGSPPQGCFASLPLSSCIPMFKDMPGKPLAEAVPRASLHAVDLLRQLLKIDPQQRISAAEALSHSYFSKGEVPATGEQLPRPAQWVKQPKAEGAQAAPAAAAPATAAALPHQAGSSRLSAEPSMRPTSPSRPPQDLSHTTSRIERDGQDVKHEAAAAGGTPAVHLIDATPVSAVLPLAAHKATISMATSARGSMLPDAPLETTGTHLGAPSTMSWASRGRPSSMGTCGSGMGTDGPPTHRLRTNLFDFAGDAGLAPSSACGGGGEGAVRTVAPRSEGCRLPTGRTEGLEAAARRASTSVAVSNGGAQLEAREGEGHPPCGWPQSGNCREPMASDGTGELRGPPSMTDLQSLRKRKLEMDAVLFQ